jgi:hypothetical protein
MIAVPISSAGTVNGSSLHRLQWYVSFMTVLSSPPLEFIDKSSGDTAECA